LCVVVSDGLLQIVTERFMIAGLENVALRVLRLHRFLDIGVELSGGLP